MMEQYYKRYARQWRAQIALQWAQLAQQQQLQQTYENAGELEVGARGRIGRFQQIQNQKRMHQEMEEAMQKAAEEQSRRPMPH
jgi:hypothetical protein